MKNSTKKHQTTDQAAVDAVDAIDALIADLKAKHGNVYMVTTEDGLTAYFIDPDIKVWRFALKALDKSPVDFKKSLANNMWKGGDKEILNDEYHNELAKEIESIIEYGDAEFAPDGNAYRVRIGDKSCLLRPMTVEVENMAQRDNPTQLAFKTEENILNRLWISGDEEIKSTQHLQYFIPVCKIVRELRTKHLVALKKL